MNLFVIFLLFLVDLIALPFSAIRRAFLRTPSEYTTSVYIAASVQAVWEVTTARELTLDGWPPLTFTSRDVADIPDAFVVHFEIFDEPLKLGLRQIELREGEAVLYETLPQYTSPEMIMGTEQYTAFGVEPERLGTRLTTTFRMFDKSIWNRAMIPLSLRLQLRRIKRHVERRNARDS